MASCFEKRSSNTEGIPAVVVEWPELPLQRVTSIFPSGPPSDAVTTPVMNAPAWVGCGLGTSVGCLVGAGVGGGVGVGRALGRCVPVPTGVASGVVVALRVGAPVGVGMAAAVDAGVELRADAGLTVALPADPADAASPGSAMEVAPADLASAATTG